MKFNGRFAWILALLLLVGAISSSAQADTVSVTIQKWTSGFGALTASSTMSVYVDGNNGSGSVGTFFGQIQYQNGPASTGFTTDPFAGAISLQMTLGLISNSSTESTLTSDLGVSKTDANSYWIKVFVEDSSFTLPGSNSTVLGSTVTYTKNTNSGTTSGVFKSSISDSGSSVSFPNATLPFTSQSNGVSFTRAASTYDVKQEWDISLTGTKTASVDGGITTHSVPEPMTILSALIGLAPLALMVRSTRRRKAVD